MSKSTFALSTATALFALISMPVHAALTAEQALNQFNLIVLHDDNSTSHVDGRTFVGGNLTGGDYVQHVGQTPASSYAGLTVLGNASGTNVNGLGITVKGNLTNANINSGAGFVGGNASSVNFNGGKSAVAGAISGVNFNGGQYTGQQKTDAINNALATAQSDDFAALFSQASSDISSLSGTGGSVVFAGNKVTFNALANSDGVAIFDLTAIDQQVFGASEYEFHLNGASTVIFNSDESTINIGANFLGGSAQTYGSKFLWNFYNASTVNLNSQFGGSIIATGAKLTNKNNIEGSVVVSSLDQQGEIHLQPFTGTIPFVPSVPEPSTYMMMLSGIALMRMFARKA